MRSIKYRGYQKNHQKMGAITRLSFDENGNIDHLVFDNGHNSIPRYSNYFRNNKDWDIELVDVMQFTGLFDKNGKEVFEGDIVQLTAEGWINEDEGFNYIYTGHVIYMPSRGYHIKVTKQLDVGNGEYMVHTNEKHITQYRTTVIGNIHDNPELLQNPQS